MGDKSPKAKNRSKKQEEARKHQKKSDRDAKAAKPVPGVQPKK